MKFFALQNYLYTYASEAVECNIHYGLDGLNQVSNGARFGFRKCIGPGVSPGAGRSIGPEFLKDIKIAEVLRLINLKKVTLSEYFTIPVRIEVPVRIDPQTPGERLNGHCLPPVAVDLRMLVAIRVDYGDDVERYVF